MSEQKSKPNGAGKAPEIDAVSVSDRVSAMARVLENVSLASFSDRGGDQNIAVLTASMVRAAVNLLVRYCPKEDLPAAVEVMVSQVFDGVVDEAGPQSSDEGPVLVSD